MTGDKTDLHRTDRLTNQQINNCIKQDKAQNTHHSVHHVETMM